MTLISITIDDKIYSAREGQTIIEAAAENGQYIPALCNFKNLTPAGTCRVCTTKVNGEYVAACTTIIENGMKIENNSREIIDKRKAVIEMLLVEGNHQCAICEKSGSCDLQGLAYRFKIMKPRFPFQFPVRKIDTLHRKIQIDTNRCIQCLRCVRGVKTKEGLPVFRVNRFHRDFQLTIDPELAEKISDEIAEGAINICPVGAILGHGEGYRTPIGKRKYDHKPIGSDIEEKEEP